MMAKNELYIAKYYSKRYAHVAAVERIKYKIKNNHSKVFAIF